MPDCKDMALQAWCPSNCWRGQGSNTPGVIGIGTRLRAAPRASERCHRQSSPSVGFVASRAWRKTLSSASSASPEPADEDVFKELLSRSMQRRSLAKGCVN
eukprot:1310835-Alexandrium_andersonii.AAC.1